MKKKTTKQMLLTVCAVALVLLTTVGTAFAYFSDHEEAQGGATLKLQGETTLHEEMDGNNKHIVIENTGEVDMIVRVAVFGTEVEGKTVMTVAGKNWTQDGDYWYYNELLAPGKSTDELVGTLTADDAEGLEAEDLEIIVVHESAPAVFNKDNTLKRPDGWTLPEIKVESLPAAN